MLSIMENELDPFAEYMWMEEQEAFDRKVIEELIEEEQIQEDFDDMMAEEDEHYNNSILPYEEEIGSQLPEDGESRSQTEQFSGMQLQHSENSTAIPESNDTIPWSNGTNQKTPDVSSDSDSEGGGPQR